MNELDFNPDAPLHVRSVSHLTIPVNDRYKATRFYVVALGAEVHHESAPDNVKMGRSRSLQVGVEAERSTSTTPDGNNLELNCPNYPGAEKLHSGPYDKGVLIYKEAWPPPELEAEANRLFESSLERARKRRM